MKPSKKNSVLNFLFAFLPGAAEMYMGFMKYGVSLLLLFMASFVIPMKMYGGDVWFVIPFVVYVYGFFHARNLAHMSDIEFATVEDKYFWYEFIDENKISIPETKMKKWAAVLLIVFGVCCIWGSVSEILRESLATYMNDEEYGMFRMIYDSIPQVVIAILAIVMGGKLISGKKKSLVIEENETEPKGEKSESEGK